MTTTPTHPSLPVRLPRTLRGGGSGRGEPAAGPVLGQPHPARAGRGTPASATRYERAGRRLASHFSAILVSIPLLSSCAAIISGEAIIREIRKDPARGVYIAGVPFFPQEPEQCGPAALAMVMAFRGRPVPLDLIASEIYLPKLKGTLTVDLLLYPRTQGFESRIHEGGFPSLLRELRQGNPVIVLLDVGLPLSALRHYAVVVGYDAGTESVIAHSGRRANMVFPRDLFEKQWRASGNWGLVVSRRGGSQPGQ